MSFFKFDLVVFVITSLISIIFNINYLYYIAFMIVAVSHALHTIREKKSLIELSFYLTLYSCILPDNYVAIACSFLFLCILIIKHRKSILTYGKDAKNNRAFIAMAIFMLVNIFLNRVNFVNVVFYVLYSFTFYCTYFLYKRKYDDKSFIIYINSIFNTIIVLQLIHTALFIILKPSIVIRNIYGDWSIGTFGGSHGYILFILACFAAIRYFQEYIICKNKKYLVLILLCFLTAVSTVNVSLTLMAFAALGVYTFVSKMKAKMKLTLAAVLILFIFIFWEISIPMIRWQIINAFTNRSFITERIKKLDGYKNTFITIPSRDIRFLLIGNGIGNYSSRAALTCTGQYVQFYNKVFKPNTSYYTATYMTPEIYAQRNISVQQMPTSQIISLMGEFGIIGLLFFLYLLFKLIKKSSELNKLTLLLFFFLCFIDNWFEFAKVGILLWTIYFIIEDKAGNDIK